MEQQSTKKPRISRGTRRVMVFAGLSIVAIGAVMYFTFSKQTVKALLAFNPRYLLALVVIWIIAFSADAVSFTFYTRGTDERIGALDSFRAAAFRVFFNLVTPFSFGGQPFVVYFLQHRGVPAGKGSSIVMVKLMSISAYVLVGAIAGFVFFHEHIVRVTVLNVLFLASGILQILFIALVVAGLLRPRLVIRGFSAVGSLFYRMKLIKNKGRFRRQLVYEANLARKSFKRYFGRHIVPFVLGTLTIGVMYFVEVITLWVIFIGLGVRIPFATGIALGALFLFLLPFLPTPGAAGLGEAFFVVLFTGLVPYYLLGVAVLLWRFFYNYLTAIAGALFSSRHFSKLIVKSETG